ncbi:hypothetical protein J2X60_001222 [Curtobacterium sp. 320]|nr:hypothetical protein [Curtobacterium sp. 320]
MSPTLLHSPPQGAEIIPEIAVVPCFGVDGGSVPARSSAEKPESSGIGDPVEGCGARGGKWRTSTARARAPAARRRLAPLVPLVPLAERAESFAQRRRAGRIAPARRPAGGVLRPFSGHLRDGRRGVAPTRASRPMARTAHPRGHDPPRADRRASAIGRRAASNGTNFARSPSGHDPPPRGLERVVFRPLGTSGRPCRIPSTGRGSTTRRTFDAEVPGTAAPGGRDATIVEPRQPRPPRRPPTQADARPTPRTHGTGPAPKDRPRGGVWRAASPGCRSACPSGRSSGP